MTIFQFVFFFRARARVSYLVSLRAVSVIVFTVFRFVHVRRCRVIGDIVLSVFFVFLLLVSILKACKVIYGVLPTQLYRKKYWLQRRKRQKTP